MSEMDDEPLAWLCTDARYGFVKGIVTTRKITVDAWRDEGIEFVGLYPRALLSPPVGDPRQASPGIVERLRDGSMPGSLMHEAADRIEALEAALRRIACFDDIAANDTLKSRGSYSHFDEPGSVQIARAALAPATKPCDQCAEPMAGPHHPECYRFIEPPAERWEVGKNGWDESDEATREDI